MRLSKILMRVSICLCLRPNTDEGDVFGLDKAFESYAAQYGIICAFLSKRGHVTRSSLGGDALDMSTWTSDECRSMGLYLEKRS